MELYYIGSDGTRINLMQAPIMAQNPETIAHNAWSYNTISGINGLARVRRFYKDTQEASLTLSIMTQDLEDYNAIMYLLHRTFDRDIRRKKPGRLWWNDFYRDVFIVGSEQQDFEERYEASEYELKIISVYPYWIRTKTYSYNEEASIDMLYLDYPYDFAYDYGLADHIDVVENDCIESANFQMKIYGPCVNPSVMIGDHVYGVDVSVLADEHILIDSLQKTIYKYDLYGNGENIFYLRNRDSDVFTKIPEGVNQIMRDKSLALEITVFDERGEPVWI